MSTRERILSHGLGISAFALFALMIGTQPVIEAQHAYAALPFGASINLAHAENGSLDRTDSSVRTGLRLQERLRRKGLSASLESTITAVRERQRLLRTSVRVHFMTETGSGATWIAGAQSDPLWIRMIPSGAGIMVSLNELRMVSTIQALQFATLPAPVDATISQIRDGDKVDRVITDQPARAGYVIDAETTKTMLVQALTLNQPSMQATVTLTPGKLINLSGYEMGDLQLLASGHSNFKGSPWGRIANVRKALRNNVHNAIVLPGETFSFNDLLLDPLIPGGRWEQAKVINGGVLTLEPGGGICQTSTTAYRAILQAGLPVLKRQSHSMYVSYYEAGGVGLDATVYRGNPDLAFLNDTSNTIVVQAYDDGEDAYVDLYGTPDGRVATLDGPYFHASAPEDFAATGKPLRKNEIGWRQQVAYPDGRILNNTIVSTYKALPRSIVTKYTEKKMEQEQTVAMQ